MTANDDARWLLSLIVHQTHRDAVREALITERREAEARWAEEVRRCERLAAQMPNLGAGILYRD